jgi:hypothetical protein
MFECQRARILGSSRAPVVGAIRCGVYLSPALRLRRIRQFEQVFSLSGRWHNCGNRRPCAHMLAWCGGSSSGANPNTGTPAGNYTISIQAAAGTFTAGTTAPVTVQ